MGNIAENNIMSNHSGETQPLNKIFSGSNFYKIPEYQRPFYWKKDNFEQLISDLIRECNENPNDEYFLGTAVFHWKDSEKIFDIVDGQQRITTLMILFACFRDVLTAVEDKDFFQQMVMQKEQRMADIPQKLRVEVRGKNIFSDKVLVEGGTLSVEDSEQLTEPEKRYVTAINVFREKLKSLTQLELEKLAKFINTKTVLIVLYANTFQHAFRLFTIVNDRGRQLRRIDVLKAKNLAQIPTERRRIELAEEWQDWETDLREDTFEDVLYLIRFIFLEEKPYTDLLEEYEKKIFGGEKKYLKWGEDFFKTVFNYSDLYNKIFEDGDYFKNNPNANKIGGLLHIMKSEFKSSDWKACLMQYVNKFKEQNIGEFLSKLELKYLEGVITGLSKDARTTAFGEIMHDINTGKKASDVIASNSLVIDLAKMKKELGGDLYGRSFAKYILLRLELLTIEHTSEHKFEAKSIEHVLPQTIVGTDWVTWFTEVEKKEWVNKLSNLVILSKSKNSSAKNYNFEDKKTKYLLPKVSGFPCSIQVTSYKEWKPADLQKRQSELIDKALLSLF